MEKITYISIKSQTPKIKIKVYFLAKIYYFLIKKKKKQK